MKRSAVPAIGMIPREPDSLSAEGFVAMAYEESTTQEPARLRPHYHDFFQVSLLHGRGRVMHDFRENDISGHTLLFITPGQVHTIIPEPGMQGTIVSFTREFFDAGSESATRLLLEFPFFFPPDVRQWITLDTHSRPPMEGLFRELKNEYDLARSDAVEVLRALLRILIVKSSRLVADQAAVPRTHRAVALVREFQLAVEKHFLTWTELEPYARKLGVTVNHLNDVVSETTARAAGEHIRLRRLLSAKRQLLHSGLSVSEIGYRLGFKDPSYFSRFFRRYAGVSPVAFRAQSREKYQQDSD